MRFIGGVDEGSVSRKLLFGLCGLLFVIVIWIGLTAGADPIMKPSSLPSPTRVLQAFPALITENNLIRNMCFSIGINLSGYLEAILITLPIGFLIGLIKYFRWGFQRQIDALRYIPLTALTGLFILWFGIYTEMKVHFLAFGIILYLLPVMIQRIDEVDDVYLKTVHTLGASDWQILRTVYFPSVLSRLSDDIRVLTAISWTYIIVAESINSTEGGLGALIYNVGQIRVRMDKVFALLIIIMAIGVIQDRVFVRLDRILFPHKYQARENARSSRILEKGIWSDILEFGIRALAWVAFGVYLLLVVQEFFPFVEGLQPLSYLFGDSVIAIHFIFFLIVAYNVYKWYDRRIDRMALEKARAPKTAGS